MKTKKLLFSLLALLLAFGLVASACGNDDDDDAASGDGGCEEYYEVRYANLATFICTSATSKPVCPISAPRTAGISPPRTLLT